MSEINPEYYGGKDNPYEVVKVCEAWGMHKDAYLFNVIKYVARAGKKKQADEILDLEKAIWYLTQKINLLRRDKLEGFKKDNNQ
jgi:hypothetical protein